MSDAATILGLLADPDRIKVVAAIVLGAASADEVSGATGLDGRTVGRVLARLQAAGLVEFRDRRYRVLVENMAEAAKSARQAGAPLGADPGPQLRNFVRDDKLVSIPATRAKRLAVLDWLAGRFEPGRVYPEREVNGLLGTAHPDVAALRRYLVDEGFMDRRQGEYWRVGGTFNVDGGERQAPSIG